MKNFSIDDCVQLLSYNTPRGNVKKIFPFTTFFNMLVEWVEIIEVSSEIRKLDLSNNDQFLASCHDDNSLRIWNTSTWSSFELMTSIELMHQMRFSNDDAFLATSADDVVKIWNTTSWQNIKTLTDYDDRITDIAFSPNVELLAAAGGLADKIVVYRTSDWSIVKNIVEHSRPVTGLTFSNDGKYLISGGEDDKIIVFDVENSF